MKNLSILLAAFALCLNACSTTLLISRAKATGDELSINANQILLPVGNTGKSISLMALSTISVKDFETLYGKKLGFFAKIGFKLSQKRLQKNIAADGTANNKLIEQFAASRKSDGNSGFHAGGFFLGLFLLWFGLIIAYSIKDQEKKRRVKWAWIGFGISAVFFISIIIMWTSALNFH